MKTKIISIMVMIAIILDSFIGAVRFGSNVEQSIDAYSIDPEKKARTDKYMAEIEQFFIDNGTTLVEQMGNQPPMDEINGPNAIKYPEKYHPYYLATWGAVKTFFEYQGYTLAWELLQHAWENTTLNSSYMPSNADRLLQVSKYTSTIANNTEYEESNFFPNAGSNADIDAYYSIFNFNYAKFYASPNTVKIELEDRYDYKLGDDYQGAENAAIKLMVEAQEVNFLTPYYVYIAHTVSGVPFSEYPTVSIINDNEYRIRNCGSGLYMDGYGDLLNLPSAFIRQYEKSNLISRRWRVKINADGTCSFTNSILNIYITEQNNDLKMVQTNNSLYQPDNNKNYQCFYTNYVSANIFYLKSKASVINNNDKVVYAQNGNLGSQIKVGANNPNNDYCLWQFLPA